MTDQNLSLAEFVPAKEQLMSLATRAKNTDITNYEETRKVRLELRDARVNLTKTGKSLREGALAFQKKVIETERELVAIITPEEDRLQAAEEEMKLKMDMEKRKDELPSRKEALALIGDGIEATDEELLKLNDNEFNEYRLMRIDAKLQKDREADEARRRAEEEETRKRREEEDRIRREKLEADEKAAAEKRAAEEKVLAEERAKIEAEKAKIAAEEKAKKEAEEAAERELARKEREAKLKADEEAREKARKEQEEKDRVETEKFQAFLKENGYSEESKEDFIIQHLNTGETRLFKVIATYAPEN